MVQKPGAIQAEEKYQGFRNQEKLGWEGSCGVAGCANMENMKKKASRIRDIRVSVMWKVKLTGIQKWKENEKQG